VHPSEFAGAEARAQRSSNSSALPAELSPLEAEQLSLGDAQGSYMIPGSIGFKRLRTVTNSH
jgi:hypothetical protein